MDNLRTWTWPLVFILLTVTHLSVADENADADRWYKKFNDGHNNFASRNYHASVRSFDAAMMILDGNQSANASVMGAMTVAGLAASFQKVLHYWNVNSDRYVGETGETNSIWRSLVARFAAGVDQYPAYFPVGRGVGDDFDHVPLAYYQFRLARALTIIGKNSEALELLDSAQRFCITNKAPIPDTPLDLNLLKGERLSQWAIGLGEERAKQLSCGQFYVDVLRLKKSTWEKIQANSPPDYLEGARNQTRQTDIKLADVTAQHKECSLKLLEEVKTKEESDAALEAAYASYAPRRGVGGTGNTRSPNTSRARMDEAVADARNAKAQQDAREAQAVGTGADRGAEAATGILQPGGSRHPQ